MTALVLLMAALLLAAGQLHRLLGLVVLSHLQTTTSVAGDLVQVVELAPDRDDLRVVVRERYTGQRSELVLAEPGQVLAAAEVLARWQRTGQLVRCMTWGGRQALCEQQEGTLVVLDARRVLAPV